MPDKGYEMVCALQAIRWWTIMIVVLIALCFLAAESLQAVANKQQEIFFKNPVIHKLDGIKLGSASIGIDGPTIHDMLWLIKQMKIMVQGTADRNSPVVKKYEFEGKSYTLGELVKLEDTLTPEQRAAFNGTTLHIARQDFEVKTHVFLIQIRTLKALVVELIDEWCETCHKQDSLLKVWGSQEVGTEFDYFHKHVSSARQLVQFMADLKDFLTKLIQSCPNAWEEFEAHQKEYAKKHS